MEPARPSMLTSVKAAVAAKDFETERMEITTSRACSRAMDIGSASMLETYFLNMASILSSGSVDGIQKASFRSGRKYFFKSALTIGGGDEKYVACNCLPSSSATAARTSAGARPGVKIGAMLSMPVSLQTRK